MNNLKAPSLQSLLESDRGSTDSLLAESLQLDFDELDDVEYLLPSIGLPTLESVLSELDSELDLTDGGIMAPTPTPSMDDHFQRSGSILRHMVLQGIKSQISSAADRIGAGLATSVAINQMIAIGTSHGIILAFDSSQTLRWCCQEHSSQGAVSSLSFNEDSTRLLAGFARGHIIMIDATTGNTIRSLSDSITPNTGILHIKWTERPTLALASDSGGSVWSLNFTRRLGIRGCTSRCLFSGARGEVCAIEPLILSDENHPLKEYSLVALATLSKFFVVMIRPRLKVIKFHAMTGPGDCLPLLAWQMVLIQAADTTRTVDPVLAAGRGNQLFFHQLCFNSGKINLLFLRRINLSYNLLSLRWMGPKSIACMDTTEMLHLCEVRTNKEQECMDMAEAGLVYGSSMFKGLATGGNVSPALALAGSHACYNSIVSRGNQLYILGGKSLHVVNVRTWSDRLTHLTQQQRWNEAVDLAINEYRAAGDRIRRKEPAKIRILKLVDDYLLATARCPEICLQAIMKCLIEVKETELLWQELWDRLPTPNLYLTILTEHIENGEITKISPIVTQSLVEHWENISTQKLEELILKIDWECLDLHQVLTISKRENLYKAQMHLNTKALGDYVISITDLMPLIKKEEPLLGNCLLVYISSCLAGRGYPTGEILPENVPIVKHEVLRCLTAIHSNLAKDTEMSYPNLRTLLEFDTRETLNVLSLAFEEKEFCGELGLSLRQRIVNILLEIMTPEQTEWSEIGYLLNFISQQIASQGLPENDSLLEKVVNYLAKDGIEGETARQHSEREEAWLELLSSDCLNHVSTVELLGMAKKAKCYRVVEYLLERSKKFEEIVGCYILDDHRHIELFSYLAKYADNPIRKIYEQIFENFEKILNINCEYLTKIIVNSFIGKITNFIRILENKPKMLFLFLECLIKENISLEFKDSETFLNLLCQFSPEKVENFLQTTETYRLEKALEIVKKYNLNSCTMLLYVKSGDFQSAYDIAIDLLKDAPESTSESSAFQVSSLCSKASEVLSENEKEKLWFNLLNIILSRPDLTSITRSILHAAGTHVDLHKLVQLVLNSGTKTGNFGDIKHLLVGMLSNSRYETLLLQTTSRILGHDLNNLLAKEKKIKSQGLCIKSIKCVVCRLRLCSQFNKIIIFGSCGHAIHEECSVKSDEKKNQCPRCGFVITEIKSVGLSEPSNDMIDKQCLEENFHRRNANGLCLEAPPRFGNKKQIF